MKRSPAGFTLLENVIVIMILAILVVIGTSNLLSWLRHFGAVDLQRELLSNLNEARTRSLASTFQHRVLIDLGAESVQLQRGNAGNGSTAWVDAAPRLAAAGGAGIETIAYPFGTAGDTVKSSGTFAFIFSPNGQVLTQDNSTISPLTQANIRLAAENDADRATIRLFGWTSKARLFNGWL
jgi:prepilin-type N-terminal cleavage/methylation domain-containing protein